MARWLRHVLCRKEVSMSRFLPVIVACGLLPLGLPAIAGVPDQTVARIADQARRGHARGNHFGANRRITGFLYRRPGIGRFSVSQIHTLSSQLNGWQATDAWRRYANARRVTLELEPGHRTLRAITSTLKAGDKPLTGYFASLVGRVPFRLSRSNSSQERSLYQGEGIGRFKPSELIARIDKLPRSLGLNALHDYIGARYDSLMREPGQRTLRRLGDFAEAKWRAGGYAKSLVGALIYPRVNPHPGN